MSFRITYANGVLDVFEGELHRIHQPFKPTSTGEQELWASEEEAMAWLSTHYAEYTATTGE
jgi:hypothetical protein